MRDAVASDAGDSRTVVVSVASNLPIRDALKDWRAGKIPRELLFGSVDIERSGKQLKPVSWAGDYIDHQPSLAGRALRRTIGRSWGVLPFQAAVLRQSCNADALYLFHAAANTALLNMRGSRLLAKPVVAVVQPLHWPSRLADRALRGADALIALSSRTARQLEQLTAGSKTNVHLLPWGPDLGFGGYAHGAGPGKGVISTGKTDRDLHTLVSAADGLSTPVSVQDVRHVLPAALPSNVVVSRRSGFDQVLAEVAGSAVVAIPLPAQPAGVSGITELNMAMAMGKPVIITRSPYIDVDVEAVQMGITVDSGDAAGWRRALDALCGDPVGAAEMGANGRRWAEDHWNADLFGSGVAKVIDDIID